MREFQDDEVAVQENGPVSLEENYVQKSSGILPRTVDDTSPRSVLSKSQPALGRSCEDPCSPVKETGAEVPLSAKLLELKKRRKELKHRVLGHSQTLPKKPASGVADILNTRAVDLPVSRIEER